MFHFIISCLITVLYVTMLCLLSKGSIDVYRIVILYHSHRHITSDLLIVTIAIFTIVSYINERNRQNNLIRAEEALKVSGCHDNPPLY